MASITNYTGQDLAGASVEGAGFKLVQGYSTPGTENICPYICGEDAEEYVGFPGTKLTSYRDRGLIKDSERTTATGINSSQSTGLWLKTKVAGINIVNTGDYIVIDNEIIYISNDGSTAGGTFIQQVATISRGHFGSQAASHAITSKYYFYAKGELKNDLDFFGDIKALTDASVSISDGPTLDLIAGEKLPGRFTKITKVASSGVILLQRR